MGISTSRQEREFDKYVDTDRRKFIVTTGRDGHDDVSPPRHPSTSIPESARSTSAGSRPRSSGSEALQPKASITSTVVVRNVQVVKWFEPPANAMIYDFVRNDGKPICWNIGEMCSDRFVDMLENKPKDRIFSGTTRVTFYFSFDAPGKGRVYAKKVLRSVAGTVEAIFQTIESIAYIAMQFQSGQRLSYADTTELLRKVKICNILIRDGRAKAVYIDAV